jgi:hypothetical protein
MGGGGEGAGRGGMCCADGDCLCHGPDPDGLTARNGPFDYDSFSLLAGMVYYPTDAEPPFAAVAICPGFLNTGPEMAPWGPFYASHGIVLITAYTGAADIPLIRAGILLDAIEALKAENDNSRSPLYQKLAGRYGTSGYSMGGGGTTIASGRDSTLLTSVPLAAWGPEGSRVSVPTLFLCGGIDGVAPCSSNSDVAYRAMPDSTPKAVAVDPVAGHLAWFGPSTISGSLSLAFQKVYLEGDERWKPLLIQGLRDYDATTNIQ